MNSKGGKGEFSQNGKCITTQTNLNSATKIYF